ncbi:MAG: outer membrane beta-barrel protein [Bacteroidales bacterium]
MKHFFLPILFFLISIPVLFAQSVKESVITGSVVEEVGSYPLEQATVRLLSLPDSALVQGTVSGTEGKFSLSVRKAGKFLVSVSFIGFETFYKEVVLPAAGGRLALGTIKVNENTLVLGEAVIEGKVPDVVLKEDTIEYNADSYKLSSNAMVEDLIKKLPGVEIDQDGNITAGGKVISKILVDGKEFFGKDVAVALKNINVEILDKLQVIDRKSEEARLTGVDDGEEEKVINLTVKEGMKKGWFGNASGAYGNKDRYEGYAMVNRFVGDNQYSMLGGLNNTNNSGFSDMGTAMYSGSNMQGGAGGGLTTSGYLGSNFNYGSEEKLSLNGNIMASGSNDDVTRKTWRENLLSNRSTFYNQQFDGFSRSRNLGGDLRLQWRIDSLTRLEFTPSLQYNTSSSHNESLYDTQREDSTYINRGNDNKETDRDGWNYSARISVSRASARKKGRKASISFLWGGNINNGTSYQRSFTRYGDERVENEAVRDTVVNQKQTENGDRQNFRIRLSYVEPFGNNNFLQMAYTLNHTRNTSERYSYNWLEDELQYSTAFDSTYSDRFKNAFLNQSLNLNIRSVRKKYNYTVGLSLDPSIMHSVNYLDEDRSFDRTVFNLGPNGEFVYLWSKHRNLRVQYRGRTQQPSINQLQPSKNITNPLYVREGNLDLKPNYVSNYTIRYNQYDAETQRSLQGMIQGRFIMNSIVNQTTYNDATGVQTTKPVNVNGVWSIEGMNMFNTPLRNKRFQLSNNINISYNRQIGFINSQKNKAHTFAMNDHLSFRYNSDLFDAGIRGNYSFSGTNNTIASKKDQTVMNYGATTNVLFYLPWNITVGSDFTYKGNKGYSASVAREEWLWNLQANVEFLRNKQATAFLRAYDLLHQRSTLSRSVTANYIEEIESNLLTDYFMIGFSYRFNTMGKGGPASGAPKRKGQPIKSRKNR